MLCPFCGYTETVVKDSRISDDGSSIRRRRHCVKCDSRFTTFERSQLREIMIVKKSGNKEFFDRDKLYRSIKNAVRKRDIGPEKVESIVSEIFKKIHDRNETEIDSAILGELVLESLKKLDKVAFVRFASVYKNFNSPEDFKNFISESV